MRGYRDSFLKNKFVMSRDFTKSPELSGRL